MPGQIEIDTFLAKANELPVFDVRTPAEFSSGHISGAFNLPLFSNEERAVVGTLYKQEGKEKATLQGLKFVGPKLTQYVDEVQRFTNKKELLIHCWRGGMRSNSLAWLLETVGFKTSTLVKGYKAYRNHVLDSFDKILELVVIGGMTGSGKTHILHELAKKGEQIIDLEKLACHKGSAFGWIGEMEQPTNEQFENDLFSTISGIDPNQLCFIEDESRMIGRLNIPETFFNQMRKARVIKLEVPKEFRVRSLIGDYSHTDIENLLISSNKLQKRLGGLKLKEITSQISSGNLADAASALLDYYDKTYIHGLSLRSNEQIHSLNCQTANPKENAELIIDFCKHNNID